MTYRLFLLALFVAGGSLFAQTPKLDDKKFFTDSQVIEMTLVADFKKLINEKMKEDFKRNFLPATVNFIFPDSTKLTGPVEIRARGAFRREKCDMPPIMINFKTADAVTFKKLGHLKLVWPCVNSSYDEQLILKEFLGYKIYNLLTDKSFQVRLVKIQCNDINKKIKAFTTYAFFIEDVDDMAKRSKCVEIKSGKFDTERTHREQTTLVAIFEYMIGNTDWSVPNFKNIKLMRGKNDSLSRPFVVPYDFDYSGLVNAKYALPVLDFGLTTIRQRLYRGFPRTMKELLPALQIFRDQKNAIHSLIANFSPLTRANKKDTTTYLDGFFETIKNEKEVNRVFIENARTE